MSGNEKVVYLNDDFESIRLLNIFIDHLRNNEMKNIILIYQGKRDEEGAVKTMFNFFGEDICSTHLGLCSRMQHLINKYIDGDDVFMGE